MQFGGPPTLLRLTLGSLAAALLAAGCEDSRKCCAHVSTGPIDSDYGYYAVIHTLDGRHLVFQITAFKPQSVDHCREDGQPHFTSVYDLSQVVPGGTTTRSLCPNLSGRFMNLTLVFPDAPLLKVTSLCEDGCVTPGGYYEPLGMDVRVPWSEIYYIEFLR